MRLGRIYYLLGKILITVGLVMFLPLICSVIYGEDTFAAFAKAIPICLVLGIALMAICRDHSHETIRKRESFLFVTMAWLCSAFLGALPFYFAHSFPDFASCFFESMSGFTTTGATAFFSVEAQPHGILLWRSIMQWLGGAGIVVMFVALIQQRTDDRGEGVSIFKAEYSGGSFSERISPRVENSAKAIAMVYVGLTLLCLLFLLLGNMSFFDAINHSMTTIATSGFSTKDMSIEAFDSAYIEWVITIFIVLAGINFGLMYITLVRGKIKHALQNQELRLYISVLLIGTAALTASLVINNYYPEGGFGYSLRKGAFQAATIITTTGFSSANYDAWPNMARFLLFFLMMAGGCAGSTAGSVKMFRWFVAIKGLGAELLGIARPKAVRKIYYNKKMLDDNSVRRITNFFFLYIVIVFLGGLALTGAGLNWLEAFGASVAAIGNIGPAIGSLGPAGHYATVSVAGKWILSFLMIVGRLEIYTVLVLFIPWMWRK